MRPHRFGPLLVAWFIMVSPAVNARPKPLTEARLVVPPAAGKPMHGGADIIRGIKRAVRPHVGDLVTYQQVREARKRLRLSRAKAQSLAGHRSIAKRVRAHWLIHISVSHKGFLYTAQAQLFRVGNPTAIANLRSQYFDPEKEAYARGMQLGAQLLNALEQATPEHSAQVAATSPKKSPRRRRPRRPTGKRSRPQPKAPAADQSATETSSHAAHLSKIPPTDVATGPNTILSQVVVYPATQRTIGFRRVVPSEPSPSTLLLALRAGSGLVRDYQLLSDSGDRSDLSYGMGAQPMFALYGRWQPPKQPWVVELETMIRPFRHDVVLDGGIAISEPRGAIVDGQTSLGYAFHISPPFLPTVRITPKVGARISYNPVGEHAGPRILGTSLVAALLGLEILVRPSSKTDLGVTIGGGPIVLYEESPDHTGDSELGYTLSTDLSARFWLNNHWALSAGGRFIYDRLSFSGPPDRVLPEGEAESMFDAHVRIIDLQTSIGLAVQL